MRNPLPTQRYPHARKRAAPYRDDGQVCKRTLSPGAAQTEDYAACATRETGTRGGGLTNVLIGRRPRPSLRRPEAIGAPGRPLPPSCCHRANCPLHRWSGGRVCRHPPGSVTGPVSGSPEVRRLDRPEMAQAREPRAMPSRATTALGRWRGRSPGRRNRVRRSCFGDGVDLRDGHPRTGRLSGSSGPRTRRHVNELAQRVDDLEAGFSHRLDALREELLGHVAGRIAAVQADYRPARVGGVAFLVVGLGLSAWANLLA